MSIKHDPGSSRGDPNPIDRMETCRQCSQPGSRRPESRSGQDGGDCSEGMGFEVGEEEGGSEFQVDGEEGQGAEGRVEEEDGELAGLKVTEDLSGHYRKLTRKSQSVSTGEDAKSVA